MALYPAAIKRLIPPGASDPRINATQVILHVAVSEQPSLHDYFAHRSGGIESHFYIRRDGTVEQYRDTDFQADANHHANDRAISVETQGMGNGEWTPQQLDAIKALLVWARDTHGIPLHKCPAWDAPGVGFHTMFGAPSQWTPVAKSCPGPDRIRQFHRLLVPWMRGADSEEITVNLRDVFRYRLFGAKGGSRTVADVLRDLDQNVRAIREDVAALREQNPKG